MTVEKKLILSDSQIADWISDNDKLFSGKLRKFYNYSRVVSLAYFSNLINRYKLNELNSIAVVSGSENEPELKLLKADSVCFFNFEDDPDNCNLDIEWPERQESKKFDLVICNQVFEHISDPRLGLSNLKKITKKNGYIYITLPTINGIHGEPYFFSAGYHPRMLERMAIEADLDCLHIGSWGSKKYLLNAVLNDWLTEKQLKRFSFLRRGMSINLPFLFMHDGRKKSEALITDSWALLRKI